MRARGCPVTGWGSAIFFLFFGGLQHCKRVFLKQTLTVTTEKKQGIRERKNHKRRATENRTRHEEDERKQLRERAFNQKCAQINLETPTQNSKHPKIWNTQKPKQKHDTVKDPKGVLHNQDARRQNTTQSKNDNTHRKKTEGMVRNKLNTDAEERNMKLKITKYTCESWTFDLFFDVSFSSVVECSSLKVGCLASCFLFMCVSPNLWKLFRIHFGLSNLFLHVL